MAVYAAGLADRCATPRALPKPASSSSSELNDAGNFVPVDRQGRLDRPGHDARSSINWDYNLLAWRDGFERQPGRWRSSCPSDGVVAGVYIQAISAYAPHPNAAKLWMEYLYSDEGQLGWLAGYCHPIRFNELAAAGKIPQDLLDKLPPAENYAKAVFPTLDEQNAAKDDDHRPVGRRRRRRTSSKAWRAVGDRSPTDGRPGSNRAGRRTSAAAAARLPHHAAPRRYPRHRALHHLRGDVPAAADAAISSCRRLHRPATAASPSTTSPASCDRQIVAAFWISIRISAASAVLGAVIGLAIALAIIRGGCRLASARR